MYYAFPPVDFRLPTLRGCLLVRSLLASLRSIISKAEEQNNTQRASGALLYVVRPLLLVAVRCGADVLTSLLKLFLCVKERSLLTVNRTLMILFCEYQKVLATRNTK